MNRAFLATLFAAGLTLSAQAGIVRSGFDAGTLGRNDDSSSAPRSLGFSAPVNFGGGSYSQLYVNNNGNVTFNAALSAFTPFGLASLNRSIIAPFFADVDTRHTASGVVSYGTGTVDGFEAFGVTWKDVGYYDRKADKLNSFQLVLINRPDTGAGNFDIEFNYDRVAWDSGNGTAAGIGYANSPGLLAYELAGSGLAGAFLDASPTGLIHDSNIGVDGRYLYEVRCGVVAPPAPPIANTPMPEPATAIYGLGVAVVCVCGRFRRVRN